MFKIYCRSDTFLNEHIKVIPTSPFPHIPLYWGAFRYLYVLSGISVAFRYFGYFPVFDRTLYIVVLTYICYKINKLLLYTKGRFLSTKGSFIYERKIFVGPK